MSDELITLQSADGQEFDVDVRAAQLSETVKNLIEDAGADAPIPLPNVSGAILRKIIDYCMHAVEHPAPAREKDAPLELSAWEQEYCKVDHATLFELILAANYMDIPALLDTTCASVANMIKGKTPDEIRGVFDIQNDFTPEEEEAVRKENEWCEER